MRILVTGTGGYLGCLLAPTLIAEGHDVTGLDTGYYAEGWLYHGLPVLPRTVVKDIRHVTAEDLRGYDAVVHMAELSNDPIGDLLGEVTYRINHEARSPWRRRRRRPGCGDSCTCPPARCTGWPTARWTSPARSTRRPRTPGARRWSNGT